MPANTIDSKTIEQIREHLLSRWKRIERSGGIDALNSHVEAPQAEMIDIAQNLEQIGRDSSLAEQERRELLAIERALAKMATGSFGVCEDCGEDIPVRRLIVLPEARLCAQCQTFEERQNARTRMPGMLDRAG